MTSVKTGTPPTIASTGFFALDVVVSSKRNDSVSMQAGGTCGNVLAILAYLGWRAKAISRMSKDTVSNAVVEDLSRIGVDMSLAFLQPTSPITLIQQRNWSTVAGKRTHRFFWKCPFCGKRSAPFRPVTRSAVAKIIQQCAPPDIFFVDRLSPASVMLAECFYEGGSLIVFEPSGRVEVQLLRRMLLCAGIVKYTGNHAIQMRDAWPRRGSKKCLEIRTEGAAGLAYRIRDSLLPEAWQNVSPVAVDNFVDASGAGDWCTAGILATLGTSGRYEFERKNEVQISDGIAAGTRLASMNCRFLGARGAMAAIPRHDIIELAGLDQQPLNAVCLSTSELNVFQGCSPECVISRCTR